MKRKLLVIALLTLPIYALAGNDHGGPPSSAGGNTSSLAAAAAGSISGASGGNASATGGSNGGNDTTFIALPSAGAAQATSGNAGIICPIITVVSTARGRIFNAWSDAEIGVEPARINLVCVLYHNAVQSNKPDDWKAFVDYAKERDDLVKAKK